eukprot:117907-Hanusia_phi.AAC.1
MEATNVHSSSPYSIHLACAVDKFLHGLPPGDFPPSCDRCGTVLDPQAPSCVTHLANCRHRCILWTQAHERLAGSLRDIIVEGGSSATLHQQGVRGTRTQ